MKIQVWKRAGVRPDVFATCGLDCRPRGVVSLSAEDHNAGHTPGPRYLCDSEVRPLPSSDSHRITAPPYRQTSTALMVQTPRQIAPENHTVYFLFEHVQRHDLLTRFAACETPGPRDTAWFQQQTYLVIASRPQAFWDMRSSAICVPQTVFALEMGSLLLFGKLVCGPQPREAQSSQEQHRRTQPLVAARSAEKSRVSSGSLSQRLPCASKRAKIPRGWLPEWL